MFFLYTLAVCKTDLRYARRRHFPVPPEIYNKKNYNLSFLSTHTLCTADIRYPQRPHFPVPPEIYNKKNYNLSFFYLHTLSAQQTFATRNARTSLCLPKFIIKKTTTLGAVHI